VARRQAARGGFERENNAICLLALLKAAIFDIEQHKIVALGSACKKPK
jgi:hypothetical protein